MKRQTLKLTATMTILLTIWLFACKKDSNVEDEKITNPVEYYSQKFLSDTSFAKFIKTAVSNQLKNAKIVNVSKQKYRTMEDLDTAAAYYNTAEIVTAQAILMMENPHFYELSEPDKQQVITNVINTVATPEFQLEYPDNELVVLERQTKPLLYDAGGIALQAKFAFVNISSFEWGACTIGLGIAALGEYGGVVGQVINLARSGVVTWSGVFDIA